MIVAAQSLNLFPGIGPEWDLPPFEYGQPINIPAPWDEYDMPSRAAIWKANKEKLKAEAEGENPNNDEPQTPELVPKHKSDRTGVEVVAALVLAVSIMVPLGYVFRRRLKELVNNVMRRFPRNPPRGGVESPDQEYPFDKSELDLDEPRSELELSYIQSKVRDILDLPESDKPKTHSSWLDAFILKLGFLGYTFEELEIIRNYLSDRRVTIALTTDSFELGLEPPNYYVGASEDVFELFVKDTEFTGTDPELIQVKDTSVVPFPTNENPPSPRNSLTPYEQEHLRLEREKFDQQMILQRQIAERDYILKEKEFEASQRLARESYALQESSANAQQEMRERELAMMPTSAERWGQTALNAGSSLLGSAATLGMMRYMSRPAAGHLPPTVNSSLRARSASVGPPQPVRQSVSLSPVTHAGARSARTGGSSVSRGVVPTPAVNSFASAGSVGGKVINQSRLAVLLPAGFSPTA